LYRKSLEEKEKLVLDKKKRIKEALDDGKKIPTELRNEEAALRKEIDFDDAFTELGRSHVDDEYARAGERDPKVLVTTSRDPTSRLGQFAKEVRLLFPNAQKINRGNTMLKEVVDAGRRHGFTDIVMVHETRGEPDSMVISHLPFGPTAYFAISNCVLRHDIKVGHPCCTVRLLCAHPAASRTERWVRCRRLTLTSFLITSPPNWEKGYAVLVVDVGCVALLLTCV